MPRCDENHLPGKDRPCMPVRKKLSGQDADRQHLQVQANPDRKFLRYPPYHYYFLYYVAASRWYPRYPCFHPLRPFDFDESGADGFPSCPGFCIFREYPGRQKYILQQPGYKKRNTCSQGKCLVFLPENSSSDTVGGSFYQKWIGDSFDSPVSIQPYSTSPHPAWESYSVFLHKPVNPLTGQSKKNEILPGTSRRNNFFIMTILYRSYSYILSRAFKLSASC